MELDGSPCEVCGRLEQDGSEPMICSECDRWHCGVCRCPEVVATTTEELGNDGD